jgi:hypothetical protein
MKRKLADTLARIDKPTETWTSPDVSAALVLPMVDASRACSGSERNFFWTHPALDSAETARAFYQGAPAIGGPGREFACEDASQLWAFRGPRKDILEAACIDFFRGLKHFRYWCRGENEFRRSQLSRAGVPGTRSFACWSGRAGCK